MMKNPIKPKFCPSGSYFVITSTDDLESQAVDIYNDDLHCAIDHPLNSCLEEDSLLVYF
jgi:hypothetical protein